MKTMLFSALVLLAGHSSFGHGMDKPGPHGGYVQMPGAFHTEVVPVGTNSFRVYLVDFEFKNPRVANSEVNLWATAGGKKIKFNCKADSDFFLCAANEKVTSPNEIIVVAKREGAQGNEARYQLPLKPWNKK